MGALQVSEGSFRNQEAEQGIAILESEKVGIVSWNGRLSLLFRKIKIFVGHSIHYTIHTFNTVLLGCKEQQAQCLTYGSGDPLADTIYPHRNDQQQ